MNSGMLNTSAAPANAWRSLPIHCVIEEITSLETTECPHFEKRNENSKWWECSCRNIEMNGCVVIPVNTTMNHLLEVVLTRLSYPSRTSCSSKGTILIRNWKALSIETITPSPKMTVGEILGELSSIITLRIQILRPKPSLIQEIKDNLLSYLIKKNHSFLSNTGCPLDMLTLTKLCGNSLHIKKHLLSEPTEELVQKFESWIRHQLKNEVINSEKVNCETSTSNINSNTMIYYKSGGGHQGDYDKLFEKSANYQLQKQPTSFENSERPKYYVPTKTRMRTSFDPELELPKLHKWYVENPHPTRQQIQEYVQELNSLESRKGRKPLDINNVVYWFKNARAAQKRSECRKFCSLPPQSINNNRCNVLRIPLGKNSSSVTSDDQRSMSDDEASINSDDYYQKEDENRLRDSDAWNPAKEPGNAKEPESCSVKNEPNQSAVKLKEERLSDNDESSREGMLSIAEESNEPTACNRVTAEERTVIQGIKEKPQERISNSEFKNTKSLENRERHEVKVESEEFMKADSSVDQISSSKTQLKNHFISFKENNGITDSSPETFLSRYKSGFSSVPHNSILGHSFMYMSQYMNSKPNNSTLSPEERRKRNRTFIDPVTEVPRLEQWFRLSTHPSHNLIARYTEELNGMPYRRKFPKLETKNVQFWFKNRRAKNKRLNYLETRN